MSTVAEVIQYLKQFDCNSSFESLLQDPETRPFFKEIYEPLREAFGPCRKPGTKGKSAGLRTILDVRNVCLNKGALDRFEKFKRTPSLFWKSLAIEDSPWLAHESAEVIVGKAYIACRAVCVDREWQAIRWRFYTVFFYSLARLLSGDGTRVSDKAKARLLTAVNRTKLVREGSTPIREHIEIFTSAGLRYTTICRELWKREHQAQDTLVDDYGPLFLLPQVDDRM